MGSDNFEALCEQLRTGKAALQKRAPSAPSCASREPTAFSALRTCRRGARTLPLLLALAASGFPGCRGVRLKERGEAITHSGSRFRIDVSSLGAPEFGHGLTIEQLHSIVADRGALAGATFRALLEDDAGLTSTTAVAWAQVRHSRDREGSSQAEVLLAIPIVLGEDFEAMIHYYARGSNTPHGLRFAYDPELPR
ncbi:MAG: hypothetical protein AB7T63_00365 [Planctomycetota bacterium]